MTVFGAAINEIAEGTGSLSSSSAKLSADSALVLKGARGASERAHTVASASEQVNATVRAVAAGMDEAATNLNAVASSTETDDRCH